MRLSVLPMLLALVGFTTAIDAQKQSLSSAKAVLEVAGMSCSACAKTVEKAAAKIPGVIAVKVNQPTGIAEIAYESGKTTPEDVAKIITRDTAFAAKVQTPKR